MITIDNLLVFDIEKYVMSIQFWATLISIIIYILCWILVKKIISKNFFKKSVSNSVRGKIHIAETVARAIATVILFVLVLQINGINVSAFLTGMGITSIIIGFALQDLLKDWIMGISIFWNEFYNIGDVIKIDNTIGKVEKLSLKCTKIKDIYTGNIVSISNREIQRVEILSDWVDIYVPFSYEMSENERKDMLGEICKKLSSIDDVRSCSSLGIQEYKESLITELVRIHAGEITAKPQIRRNAQTVVKNVYENRGLAIPYNKLDVNIIEKK